MKKRVMAIALILLLCVGLLPAGALGAVIEPTLTWDTAWDKTGTVEYLDNNVLRVYKVGEDAELALTSEAGDGWISFTGGLQLEEGATLSLYSVSADVSNLIATLTVPEHEDRLARTVTGTVTVAAAEGGKFSFALTDAAVPTGYMNYIASNPGPEDFYAPDLTITGGALLDAFALAVADGNDGGSPLVMLPMTAPEALTGLSLENCVAGTYVDGSTFSDASLALSGGSESTFVYFRANETAVLVLGSPMAAGEFAITNPSNDPWTVTMTGVAAKGGILQVPEGAVVNLLTANAEPIASLAGEGFGGGGYLTVDGTALELGNFFADEGSEAAVEEGCTLTMKVADPYSETPISTTVLSGPASMAVYDLDYVDNDQINTVTLENADSTLTYNDGTNVFTLNGEMDAAWSVYSDNSAPWLNNENPGFFSPPGAPSRWKAAL